ncbi:MAG: Renalase [Chroococcopsis gigantea SAG 12.99]|jgi:renalase|nr:FAD-dependent oxidoreductase [Chlorogloea purpurea SAG 13.99]MDV3000718.1 Renalase [Chroococcopsis gigantea SAG 12.99]
MSVENFLFDFGIIGAGIAGLTCAKRLQSGGFSVVVLDKSRGVGGRLATRRIDSTPVDHGLPYITPDGQYTENLISLCHPWTSSPPTYIHPDGINSIPKSLREGLTIHRNFLVTSVAYGDTWRIKSEAGEVAAKSLIIAIPAPQALSLLKNSNFTEADFLQALASVHYEPCITFMAGYSQPLPDNYPLFSRSITADIRWVGLDSSKRVNPPQSLIVIHSSPDFAAANFDLSPLESLAPMLLSQAGLPAPDWLQVHRWRYALPLIRLPFDYLKSSIVPLYICGDFCCDSLPPLEAAMTSAVAVVNALIYQSC